MIIYILRCKFKVHLETIIGWRIFLQCTPSWKQTYNPSIIRYVLLELEPSSNNRFVVRNYNWTSSVKIYNGNFPSPITLSLPQILWYFNSKNWIKNKNSTSLEPSVKKFCLLILHLLMNGTYLINLLVSCDPNKSYSNKPYTYPPILRINE